MRTGKAEIGENAIAHELGHKAEAVVAGAARRRPSMMRSLQGLPLSMAIGSNPLRSTRKSARTARVMQEALFYGFSLERRVPDNRLLRKIDRFVDLSEVRAHLGPYYSDVGRPSLIRSC
jgi:hypothetical protein